jgi:hypothetical protein
MAGDAEIMHYLFSLTASVALRALFYPVIISLLVMTGKALHSSQLMLPVRH